MTTTLPICRSIHVFDRQQKPYRCRFATIEQADSWTRETLEEHFVFQGCPIDPLDIRIVEAPGEAEGLVAVLASTQVRVLGKLTGGQIIAHITEEDYDATFKRLGTIEVVRKLIRKFASR